MRDRGGFGKESLLIYTRLPEEGKGVNISRRDFLAGAGGACAAVACGAASGAEAGPRPNVLFILADDLGWGDLGCYGHPHIKTPNLDRLAGQGIQFTRGYVNSPVCSPTRAGFMTGQFPARNGIHGHFATPKLNTQRDMPQWLDPTAPTVTRQFQQAGYRVGHFGKWHLGGGVEGDPAAPPPSAYGIDTSRVYVGNGPTWELDDAWLAHSSEYIVDASIAFLEEHKARPFYLQTWLKDPHAILAPTAEQRERYKKYGGALETFYAVVDNLDRQVGRLLDRLESLGLAENTLVLFMSDNGPEEIQVYNASHSGVGSPGPFRGRKRSLYEGGIRVPMILRWPGQAPAGRVDDHTVFSGVDLMPTLCSACGIGSPGEDVVDGEDLSAAFHGQDTDRRKTLYWEFRSDVLGHVVNRSPLLAVRDGDWKLLMNPDGSRVELYEVAEDPREMDNLAERKKHIRKDLERQALKFYAQMPQAMITPRAGKNDYPWPGAAASKGS